MGNTALPLKPNTITRITTHGKFSELMISIATEDLPDPEPPAIPIIVISAHGGEYRARSSAMAGMEETVDGVSSVKLPRDLAHGPGYI